MMKVLRKLITICSGEREAQIRQEENEASLEHDDIEVGGKSELRPGEMRIFNPLNISIKSMAELRMRREVRETKEIEMQE